LVGSRRKSLLKVAAGFALEDGFIETPLSLEAQLKRTGGLLVAIKPTSRIKMSVRNAQLSEGQIHTLHQ